MLHNPIHTTPEALLEALQFDMECDYRNSVWADVVTPKTPEAVQYMDETGGTFEDFLHDECFTCAILGKPFMFKDGVELRDGWVHLDADFVGAL